MVGHYIVGIRRAHLLDCICVVRYYGLFIDMNIGIVRRIELSLIMYRHRHISLGLPAMISDL